MSHDHSHHISHYNRAFAIGVLLNLIFVVIEAGYGFFANSLALLADAGHNLSDVVSLLLAWGANVLASKAATDKRTFGYKKSTVLASLMSSVLLMAALASIAWHAIERFENPQPVTGMTVIVVSLIGVVINTLTALLFVQGQKHDLNIRGAFLHMAADAAVSLGVVIAGIVILFKNWQWVDPVVSLSIVVIVFIGTWGLFKDSLNYATDAVPKNISIEKLKQYFLSIEHVTGVHGLRVWPLSTTESALIVHLVTDNNALNNDFLIEVQHHLHDHFDIEHATIQVESSQGSAGCMFNHGHAHG
ncbi:MULTISPECIES: cation diffusion facilitator family transporter [Pseudoalteromonas]|uniref:cation diffusion facilitator family transporter n=2 Tax=Pseudoalteromonas TaxID=53246 RepID=UPI0002CA4854|nr:MULTISPECIES: cation diffusion facilitator family transporter [Pseudoalteromonas]MAJ39315.1 cation transporter [Pseudoalteromonadaceae bacterium]OUX90972.1 MAG: cation transporter [Pseudoalteromonas sp. TMED43]ENN99747.1 Cobalt-zinc-cadmium resistance protein CzcD [Pseudoalteromonas agarivorans S816]KPV92605.1 Cadmium, cobalt and zinc/H(+)-K(+) antiporter [Pseudoalteromonas sp. P1-30]KPW03349.1 Cadmium, cobalt and zinc/H(+)-K(+) antiporter [Pseudoalteromonas sp. P1-11]